MSSDPPKVSTARPDDVVIQVENLKVVYRVGFLGRPKTAVQDVSFSVGHNEIFGYIGANGAGKTTTIKTLVGLQRPTAGSCAVMGQPSHCAASRARVGFLPENPYFYEYLTAREAMHFYAELCDVPSRIAAERTRELLAEVQIEHAADRPIRGYSKGMRQRLGLAQALINDPEVVILDEPMSGLDPLGRAHVRDIILSMRDRGRTVFFSTHILSDVEAICSRVCLIDGGRIQAIGELSQLLRREVKSVELTVTGISPAVAEQLGVNARRNWTSGESCFFTYDDEETAQLQAIEAIKAGGRVRALQPNHENLEDLFLKTAGKGSAIAARASEGTPS